MSSQLLVFQCRRKMNTKSQVQGLLPRSHCSGMAGCPLSPKQIFEREDDYALKSK